MPITKVGKLLFQLLACGISEDQLEDLISKPTYDGSSEGIMAVVMGTKTYIDAADYYYDSNISVDIGYILLNFDLDLSGQDMSALISNLSHQGYFALSHQLVTKYTKERFDPDYMFPGDLEGEDLEAFNNLLL